MDVHVVTSSHFSPQRHVYIEGDGNANHNPPNMGTALNGPKSERHDDHARGINRVRAGLPRKNQHANDITSVR